MRPLLPVGYHVQSKVWYPYVVCAINSSSKLVPVPGGYSHGHEKYQGRQDGASEANDARAPVLSARTICTRRDIDGG